LGRPRFLEAASEISVIALSPSDQPRLNLPHRLDDYQRGADRAAAVSLPGNSLK